MIGGEDGAVELGDGGPFGGADAGPGGGAAFGGLVLLAVDAEVPGEGAAVGVVHHAFGSFGVGEGVAGELAFGWVEFPGSDPGVVGGEYRRGGEGEQGECGEYFFHGRPSFWDWGRDESDGLNEVD